MRFIALNETDIEKFADAPEFARGVQYGRSRPSPNEAQFDTMILGGRVAIIEEKPEDHDEDPLDLSNFLKREWMKPGISMSDREKHFVNWTLKSIKTHSFIFDPLTFTPQITFPLSPMPSPASKPATPPVIYGHLPFSTTTTTGDVFYHFEPFPPPSPRVHLKKSSVKDWVIEANTFANPPSELLFFPSGFAVTARNALPGLLPACFRYEIRPDPGSQILCGAGVPLYGHAGGGVEIKFLNLTDNVGPVADPVFVSPL